MVFLDFLIRQIHEVNEDNIDVFKMAFQILNIRLHQLGLTGSTNARDDLDVRSAIQFNDSVEILCSCTVSYTHLDVYKRQVVYCHIAIPPLQNLLAEEGFLWYY